MPHLKLWFICLITLTVHPRSDLGRFLAATPQKIIRVKSISDLSQRLRYQTSTECPGIIVALFSPGGKLLSVNEIQPAEIRQLKTLNYRNGVILCISFRDELFVYTSIKK